jgi:ketosteroid isomerase-like protein
MRSSHILVAAAWLCTAGTASAADLPGFPGVRVHGPAAFAQSLLAAEMAFEKRSEAGGTAAAMHDFMDSVDGLSFDGGEPNRGQAAIVSAHGSASAGGQLSWAPNEVFVSLAGDMGATWGHFRFVPPGAGKTRVVTGRYVTVWRRDAAHKWKGIIDIGNPDE